jgi:hypothetical protein
MAYSKMEYVVQKSSDAAAEVFTAVIITVSAVIAVVAVVAIDITVALSPSPPPPLLSQPPSPVLPPLTVVADGVLQNGIPCSKKAVYLLQHTITTRVTFFSHFFWHCCHNC